MHWQAYQFLIDVKNILRDKFVETSVLEIGSYSVNGSIRELFLPRKYIGVDLIPGEGVDQVVSGHEFKADREFDVALSCECFEHNPFYLETLSNMYSHLKEDGVVIFTCATTGRPEHGTSRTEPDLSPGTSALNWDYYKNLTSSDFSEFLDKNRLQHYLFLENKISSDLYFIGVKSKADALRLKEFEQRLIDNTLIFEKISENIASWRDCLNGYSGDVLSPDLLFTLFRSDNGAIKDNKFKYHLIESYMEFPNSPVLNYLMSEYELHINNIDKSFCYAKRSLVAERDNLFYVNHYVNLLANQDRLFDAIHILKDSDISSNVGLLLKLSNLYFKVEDFQSGMKAIDDALKIQEDNPILLNQKRRLYVALDDYEQAILLSKRLVEANDVADWIVENCRNFLTSHSR